MNLKPEKQYDESRQMEIWSEGFSNEGHVYAALGVETTSRAFENPSCLLAIPANVKQEHAKSQ